jgi:arsenate reductase
VVTPSMNGTAHTRPGLEPPLVLFICRANSGPSILAEAILRHLSRGRVRAASAGEKAAEQINPCALECLVAHRIPTAGLWPKPWGEFFGLFRPPVRVLIALGNPNAYAMGIDWNQPGVRTAKAHWPTPDPEAVVGSETEVRLACEEVFALLEARIRRFLALPLDRLSDEALLQALARIGEVQGDLS